MKGIDVVKYNPFTHVRKGTYLCANGWGYWMVTHAKYGWNLWHIKPGHESKKIDIYPSAKKAIAYAHVMMQGYLNPRRY